MGVFDRQRASAARLIAKYGQSVTWEQRSAAGGSAAKPGSTVVTNNTVIMAFVPLHREYLQTILSMIKDTDIPAGLIVGLMGPVSFTPGLKDTVLRGTERLNVIDDNGIEIIQPNSEAAILYIVRLSR